MLSDFAGGLILRRVVTRISFVSYISVSAGFFYYNFTFKTITDLGIKNEWEVESCKRTETLNCHLIFEFIKNLKN